MTTTSCSSHVTCHPMTGHQLSSAPLRMWNNVTSPPARLRWPVLQLDANQQRPGCYPLHLENSYRSVESWWTLNCNSIINVCWWTTHPKSQRCGGQRPPTRKRSFTNTNATFCFCFGTDAASGTHSRQSDRKPGRLRVRSPRLGSGRSPRAWRPQTRMCPQRPPPRTSSPAWAAWTPPSPRWCAAGSWPVRCSLPSTEPDLFWRLKS